LATPCSAPGISTGLAWCLGKPPALIYLVFFAMGLGMSSPYLILGLRPELLRFLPRPGKWMETFKQAMGFVLMATVVYLLTIISPASIIPTIALLFGAWAGCWWIGRVPYVAELPVRLRAYAVAVTITIAVGAYAFAGHFQVGDTTLWGLRGTMAYRLGDGQRAEFELPWEPFSITRLEDLLEDRQTVMVDFTADWCATCKWLEQRVLNTRPIYESVSRLGITTLKADYDQPEVKQLARRLGRSGIPILVIFPHGDPSQPILLPTNYSRGQLLEALAEIEMSDAAIARR
jgi:thiol:disulfide interchange protein DsbD